MMHDKKSEIRISKPENGSTSSPSWAKSKDNSKIQISQTNPSLVMASDQRERGNLYVENVMRLLRRFLTSSQWHVEKSKIVSDRKDAKYAKILEK